ncbi:MAG TPA: VWA domain-containing protein [Fulvivirga sp.]|nr:VWA domain-containing protein [Fulvivirga sp.]
MTWLYSMTFTEIILIGLFIVFYLGYIIRASITARRLKVSYGKIFVKFFIRTLFFSLLIMALLGPSFGESKREVKSVGKDIFMLVDLSESMNATDIQPSRLEKIKFELKNIVDAFSSDRIGVIIFSGEAFMQSPLTYDQNALNLFIETLNTGLVPNAGTDFGPPLKMAMEKLDSEQSPLSQQKSKIIILISDGEDFGDNTSEIAKDLDDDGITLFTLGVGTERGSKLMTRNGYKKDREGNDIVTKLDPKSLIKLAKDASGQYFEINETKNDVSRLISTINKIEGELRDSRQVDVSANRYYYFLLAALCLILLDILVSVKVIKI